MANMAQMCTSGGRSFGGGGNRSDGNNLVALEGVKGFTRL